MGSRVRPANAARRGMETTVLLDRVPSKRRRGRPGPLGLAVLVAVLLLSFGVGAALLTPDLTGGRADPAQAAASDPGRSEAQSDGQSDEAAPESEPASGSSPTAGSTSAPTAKPSPSRTRTSTPAPRRTTSEPKPKPTPSKSTENQVSVTTVLENEVTQLTNVERAKVGCAGLRTDERLRTAARRHSQDMADRNYFSHTSLDGRSPWDRAEAAGYPQAGAENIAKGQPTPGDVVTAWMNSEGHRNNILNCQLKAIGVGLAHDGNVPVWTQLFGAV